MKDNQSAGMIKCTIDNDEKIKGNVSMSITHSLVKPVRFFINCLGIHPNSLSSSWYGWNLFKIIILMLQLGIVQTLRLFSSPKTYPQVYDLLPSKLLFV